MQFRKMHGLGNDFVMTKVEFLPEHVSLEKLARKVCDRHFGVGADGLIIAYPSSTEDIRMRIFNSDGTEAEMCGNGIRCFAKYVYEEKMVTKTKMTVETLAGVMIPVLNIDDDHIIQDVTVDMNRPHLSARDIPVDLDQESVVSHALCVDDKTYFVTCVSMGNPHCVQFIEDIDQAEVKTLGPIMEGHSFFPNKTNVEFVQVIRRDELAMRVWERGAAETLACGTGACASLVAAVLNDFSDRRATLHLAGGDLYIEWNEKDNHVYMTGPADNVFDGEYFI